MGEEAFRSLRCGACHEVQGRPGLSMARRLSPAPTLIRGNPKFGPGDWATAIVAPAHEVSWSRAREDGDLEELDMPEYYDLMTIGELMDLVAFFGIEGRE